ncbi:MAG: helix-turn-helix transcriptional regulator [Terracidiphilus sp.]|nr:helix-turn-helix transcriptional regulator [Terracidiphilus sp.]
MARGFCPRHGGGHACTCAMGNLYRFIEPVLLLMLRDKGHSYGYELSENLAEYALTDAQIERAALYRTLRTLEENGHVTSTWDTDTAGPARRVYSLTESGRAHLQEWSEVMGRLAGAMEAFAKRAAMPGAGA